MVSFDQRAKRSPALTTMVPSIGVALTKVPFGERTWRPPRMSWKRRVIEPGSCISVLQCDQTMLADDADDGQ